MKTIEGWWFAPKNNRLANGDNRKIKIGTIHKVEGTPIPCKHGLHLAQRILDALRYAPGPIIYKVKGSGITVPHGNPINKYACSIREYIKGGTDCTNILEKFTRLCALDVISLWEPPQIVIDYLKTGDKKIRYAARRGARSVAEDVIRGAARSAARSATQDTAWSVAWSVARDAAWSTAWSVARSAARDAAREKQNKRLTSMISRAIKH